MKAATTVLLVVLTITLTPGQPYVAFVSSSLFQSTGNSLRAAMNVRTDNLYAGGQVVITVAIDVQPGSNHNPINPKSKGVIPVAILTTATFDATTVAPLSVEFGPGKTTEAHGKGHIEDVDGDGDKDLVLHFRTQEAGIRCGQTSAGLTGVTEEGEEIEAEAAIVTVGCKK